MDNNDLEKINDLLDKDVEIREKIKEQVNELDKKARTMAGILNRVHSTPPGALPPLLDSVRPVLQSCQDTMSQLASIVPENQFWRWKDMWTNSLRTAISAVAMVQYLTKRDLVSLQQVSDTLGFKVEWANRVALPVEDYLHGVISLVNDLSRLAVNSVTLGNFEEPIKISIFVKDLFAGFSMLNLKNDVLRRRFDGLKYDIKKIEEVVYDVSLRKLATVKTASADMES
ncbi:Translin [Macrolepiota fuliginosa MF-IS2]|uniref:Translin n=1 Tax=Macrolepiota fuliginosa MF-IS2 TaxID=1400762 RepID=A0A9P5XSA8_9AGAR|nr:Translin [Macrolepiota fuliginosa MF-IS2]